MYSRFVNKDRMILCRGRSPRWQTRAAARLFGEGSQSSTMCTRCSRSRFLYFPREFRTHRNVRCPENLRNFLPFKADLPQIKHCSGSGTQVTCGSFGIDKAFRTGSIRIGDGLRDFTDVGHQLDAVQPAGITPQNAAECHHQESSSLRFTQ
jgi:hypothetical protein